MTGPVPTLDYRGRPDRVDRPGRVDLPPARSSAEFRLGRACWAVPLVAGVTDGLIYAVSGWRGFLFVGVAIAVIGVVLSGVGVLAALALLRTRWRDEPDLNERLRLPLLLIFLQASNYVVGGCVFGLTQAVRPILQ